MSITVRDISGVGEAAAQLLAKLNIYTPVDLLFHLPRDYEDRSRIIPMHQLFVGKTALLQGIIQSVDFPPGNRSSMAIQISDGMGKITLRFYQIYKGLKEKFQIGKTVRVFGEVRVGARGLELYHPEYNIVQPDEPLPASRLTSIYPTTEGLTQTKLRHYVDQALQHYSHHLPELLPVDLLPAELVKHYDMQAALRYIHQPPASANVFNLTAGRHPAQQRLIFEELVAHQISLLTRRYYIQSIAAPSLIPSQRLLKQFMDDLPYQPTHAQQRVSVEILQDLQQGKPMLRLLQGDVGAGKTLVAAIATCHALDSQWQVALMAPTEILAEQHFINFSQWFEPLGIQVAWLSGKQKGKARELAEHRVKTGQAQLVIGTHALFQQAVQFKQLGLVIIDEQHRFGVDQRLSLREKGSAGTTPHQLVMTATPIPRTLAMSAYGDLDTSIIDELPPGRTPITTVTIPFERREEVISRIAANCSEGRQAYWVCTLVEQSESLDAQAAEVTFADLTTRLPHLKLGLVHGRMKPEQKQSVMRAFKNNELHLLIATTVIEVGVDVPNASLMIIENSERLGLSQLHQLRGRVGRGSTASFCVLMYKSPLSEHGKERLSTLRSSTDGFVIAEKDLELRGPGEILGTRQTGLLGFRLANLQRDEHLLPQAQQVAARMLNAYPELCEALLNRWLPQAPRYAYV